MRLHVIEDAAENQDGPTLGYFPGRITRSTCGSDGGLLAVPLAVPRHAPARCCCLDRHAGDPAPHPPLLIVLFLALKASQRCQQYPAMAAHRSQPMQGKAKP